MNGTLLLLRIFLFYFIFFAAIFSYFTFSHTSSTLNLLLPAHPYDIQPKIDRKRQKEREKTKKSTDTHVYSTYSLHLFFNTFQIFCSRYIYVYLSIEVFLSACVNITYIICLKAYKMFSEKVNVGKMRRNVAEKRSSTTSTPRFNTTNGDIILCQVWHY